jgi:hypothetical protein
MYSDVSNFLLVFLALEDFNSLDSLDRVVEKVVFTAFKRFSA